ncbi:unnamed protein product [Arabidopsis lyrata]|nr:unnamed protein product [Arabidopsis lyrata]
MTKKKLDFQGSTSNAKTVSENVTGKHTSPWEDERELSCWRVGSTSEVIGKKRSLSLYVKGENKVSWFMEFNELPEIIRTPLQKLCLHIKSLQVGSICSCLAKALQPLDALAVENAIDFGEESGSVSFGSSDWIGGEPWFGELGPWFGELGPWFGEKDRGSASLIRGPWFGELGPWFGEKNRGVTVVGKGNRGSARTVVGKGNHGSVGSLVRWSAWFGGALVRCDPRLVRRDPRFVRRDPRFVRRDPRFVRRDPRFVRRDPRLVQSDPRFVQSDLRFVRRDPRFVRRDPRFVRRDPWFVRRDLRFVRRDPRFVRRDPQFVRRDPRLQTSYDKVCSVEFVRHGEGVLVRPGRRKCFCTLKADKLKWHATVESLTITDLCNDDLEPFPEFADGVPTEVTEAGVGEDGT